MESSFGVFSVIGAQSIHQVTYNGILSPINVYSMLYDEKSYMVAHIMFSVV